jgi:hypothetical protein
MSLSLKTIPGVIEKRVEIQKSYNWSLLDKIIGEDLNTLEPALNSGSSSSCKSPTIECEDIFETFIVKSSNNLQHTSKSYSVSE